MTATTLTQALDERAERDPHGIAIRFLEDGDRQESVLTAAELREWARAIGHDLYQRGLAGKAVLLLSTPGLEYIAGYYGCLYAGALAVPAYPPDPSRLQRTLPRLLAIANDAGAEAILTTKAFAQLAKMMLPAGTPLSKVPIVETSRQREPAPPDWRNETITGDTVAFLQYTSGSTGDPKGVVVTHKNLIHNIGLITGMGAYREYGVCCAWLPPFHDMGLIGCIIMPIFYGMPTVLMSPLAFLQKPSRWMHAMSRYRATITFAPNMGFSLAARKTTVEERAEMDLSALEVCISGAEPIAAETLEAFIHHFEPAKLRRECIHPGYGLAEATLVVASNALLKGPKYLTVSRTELARGKVVPAASDGEEAQTLCAIGPQRDKVQIVEPQSRRPLPEGEVGEVWVGGDSVAQGYWKRPELSEQVFRATFGDGHADGSTWLRTGDLGFILDNDLYITGRLKDLIIVAGRNYYPHDIEAAAESAHTALRTGTSAAFSIEEGGQERLALTIEIAKDAKDYEPVCAAIRAAVWTNEGLPVHAIALLPPGGSMKTSSGKIQRRGCRQAFLDGTIGAVHVWRDKSEPPVELAAVSDKRALVEGFLRERVAELTACAASAVDPGKSLVDAGVASLMAVRLQDRLRSELGLDVALTVLLGPHSLRDVAAAAVGEVDLGAARAVTLEADQRNRHQPFPLRDIQQAYWFGRRPDVELGGIPTEVYFELDAPTLDVARFERALRKCIRRHDMLRAIIMPSGHQRILPKVPEYQVTVTDLSGVPAAQRDAQLLAIRERLHRIEREPHQWPLFDFEAAVLPNGTGRIFVRFDTLVIDGSSAPLLVDELRKLYDNPDAELPEIKISFRDFVIAERAQAETAEHQQRVAAARPAETPRPPGLPLALAPEALRDTRFTHRTVRIPADVWRRLRDEARRANVTPIALLVAAYTEVLGYWSKDPKFYLTLFTTTRPAWHPDLPKVLGPFSATLLVENAPEGDTFAARAAGTQANVQHALEYADIGAIKVLRALAHESARVPQAVPIVFTSMLDASFKGSGGGLSLVNSYTDERAAGAWMVQRVEESGGDLLVHWDYIDELFPPGLMDRMIDGEARLLRTLAERGVSASLDLADVMLSEGERADRARVAATAIQPIPTQLLHEPFVEHAVRNPDAIAVDAVDRKISYGELHRRAAQLGGELRQLGMRPGDHVAVVMHKGWEQVVAVLGIELAGGVYVPIDAALPPARIASLLDASSSAIAVTQRSHAEQLPATTQVVVVATDAPTGAPATFERTRAPGDPAYVIFTSGSTGTPKGVVIHHAGALNTIDDVNRRFGVGPHDRIFGISSLSFDLSVYDVFGALAVGATLVLPEPSEHPDPAKWRARAAEAGVTVWNSVPALMQLLVQHADADGELLPASLRLVLLSGDWIPTSLPDDIRRTRPDAEIISMGGATEGSIWSIIYPIGKVGRDWRSIPYGHAMANQQMLVLDHRMQVRPDFVPGEIFIGGAGVLLEYWRDEAKTRERVIVHPRTGERLYRTGDLGRYLAGGEIEFLGREDFQVKVRGFRVELGEIEAALLRHSRVKEAVVTARRRGATAGADTQLVGYVVADGPPVPVAELRAHLEAQLPAYMVPARFVALAALPLTPNGKVDRGRLPEPDDGERTHDAEQAMDELETMVARVLADVLGIPTVGLRDNFFELGGDSIRALQTAVKLKTHGYTVGVQQFVGNPTVAGVADVLRRYKKEGTGKADEARGPAPIAPAQRRFTHERAWVAASVKLPARTTASAVEHVLRRTVARHDALRLAPAAGDTTALHPIAGAAPVVRAVRGGVPAQIASQLAAELAPAEGRTVIAGVVEPDDAAAPQLVIVADALVADRRSLALVIEELEVGMQAAARGTTADLPAPATTWHTWATAAASKAHDAAPPAETTSSRVRGEPMRIELQPALWSRLVAATTRAYRMTPGEAVTAVVARAVELRDRSAQVVIELAVDGRATLPHLDVSRTVGRFEDCRACAVPASEVGAAFLLGTRDASRGFALARPQGTPAARVTHASGDALPADSTFTFALEPIEHAAATRADVEVRSFVAGGALHVEIAPVGEASPDAARRLAAELERAATEIAEHAASDAAGGYTPVDFPLVALSPAEIEAITSPRDHVIAALPLTPMQAEMAAHLQAAAGTQAYTTQVSLVLRGALDLDAFRRAWAHAGAVHPALRTTFHLGGRTPVQLVHATRELDWRVEDLRGRSDRDAALAAFLRDDHARGVDLATHPIRWTVHRMSDELAAVTCTASHLALDAWSVRNLLDEVIRHYDGSPRPAPAADARPAYESFVRHLGERDEHEAEAFWRQRLAAHPTPAHRLSRTQPVRAEATTIERRTVAPDVVAALRARYARTGITLSTLVQGAWALASMQNGRDTACWGLAVSGRPTTLRGVEQMAGLFTTIVPMLAHASRERTLRAWLSGLHDTRHQHEDHGFAGPAAIRRWGGLDEDPFDTCIHYVERTIAPGQKLGARLAIESFQVTDLWHYPATLEVYAYEAHLELALFSAIAAQDGARTLDAAVRLLAAFPDAADDELASVLGRLG